MSGDDVTPLLVLLGIICVGSLMLHAESFVEWVITLAVIVLLYKLLTIGVL